MKQNLLNRFVLISMFGLGALSACGPQAFVPTTVISNQDAAGGMNLPPKVDIVLGLSNGGTMQNIYPGLQPELQAFAANLQKKGWDYRFISISLSETTPGSQALIASNVAVSNYHTNYPQSAWLPPFPGANYADPSLHLTDALFNSVLNIPSLDYTYNNGRESGLKNQLQFISRPDVQSGILRPDALLAMVTITNGKDTSDGWYAAWNGMQSYPVNVDQYVSQIRSLKPNSKYYSIAASPYTFQNCRGGGAWSGIAYKEAAEKMGGIFQDICSTPITNALNSISEHLQVVKLNYIKSYLVLNTQPNTATIKVFKNGVEIPAGSTNGWEYIGMSTQHIITSPIPMNQATGYMIRLNGTAKMNGADVARVEYMNAGSQATY